MKPCHSFGQYFTGPISRALGNAGRASLSSTEGSFLNPAVLVHTKNYQLGTYYGQQAVEPAIKIKDMAVMAVDNNPDAIVPASLSYVKRQLDIPGQTSEEDDFQLSFAQFIFDNVSFGFSVRYFRDKTPNNEKSLFNGGLGLLYTPTESLGLAFVSYNMFNSYSKQISPVMGVGVHYLYEKILRERFDILFPEKDNEDKKGIIMWGTEIIFPYEFSLRLGLRMDDYIKKNHFTTGLGWDGPHIGIDYSFEANVRLNEESNHYIDLRLYF